MEHLRFTQLCFLILITAAPCPNIAMASENHAGGTQGSSSSNTNVTVYHCEGCKSTECESNDYENFHVIAETQNETFSNGTIQLEINDTHISLCFQYTSVKGVYAIFWKKKGGVGDSCASISNSGASSENLRGNTTRTCCVAETNISKPKPSLDCYTEICSKKSTESPTNDTGIALKVTDVHDKSNINIIITVMILGLAVTAVAAFCVRRKRNGQGPVFVLHQVFNAVKKTGEGPEMENLA